MPFNGIRAYDDLFTKWRQCTDGASTEENMRLLFGSEENFLHQKACLQETIDAVLKAIDDDPEIDVSSNAPRQKHAVSGLTDRWYTGYPWLFGRSDDSRDRDSRRTTQVGGRRNSKEDQRKPPFHALFPV